MRLRKLLTVSLAVVLGSLALSAAPPAIAKPDKDLPDCSEPWLRAEDYDKHDRASLHGVEYRAKRSSRDVEPGTDKSWRRVGDCRPKASFAYFSYWGYGDRDYWVADIAESGNAENLTTIMYAFAGVQDGECVLDPNTDADWEMPIDAEHSVDGVADDPDQELKGHFNQLLKLKELYPHLSVTLSVGGGTWSQGFSDVDGEWAAFADSCAALIEDPRWEGLFDGVDIDWKTPNFCPGWGTYCDESGPGVMVDMLRELRRALGEDAVISVATPVNTWEGNHLDSTDWVGASEYADHYNMLSYYYHGSWEPERIGNHAPLYWTEGQPAEPLSIEETVDWYLDHGMDPEKLNLGFSLAAQGWTGVDDPAVGSSATGLAEGQYETDPGYADWNWISERCPANGVDGGTAHCWNGEDWWSYDSVETVALKVDWAMEKGLGGVWAWELSNDNDEGEFFGQIRESLYD
ncbi:glycoside hydrolase family 18 protein [Salininema proteolyticum]|uniref:chitinase n=1 Tax=Salininema proteolyticum TaxID=1607685 RepID=A0ABV8TX72_9ACTN